MKKNGIYLQ